MGRSTRHYAQLQRVADAQGDTDGWATVAPGIDERSVSPLTELGLAEAASPDAQAALSVRSGRPVLWAVRLTDDGWDALLYARTQPAPAPPVEPLAPGHQEVALRRSEMDAVRRYIGLDGQLRTPPAPGLESAVKAARFDMESNRWLVHVTDSQAQSLARGLFLERISGSAAAANRIAREFGVIYPPRQLRFTPASTRGEADAT
ncbi:DUF6417 family protein [Streptomyces sp. NPDC087300]|uniref:DUF6417 family protein n=1 Tax=Streptomyces sp. NPDC087300 TaxID=3365780 RepID=UPI003825AC6F